MRKLRRAVAVTILFCFLSSVAGVLTPAYADTRDAAAGAAAVSAAPLGLASQATLRRHIQAADARLTSGVRVQQQQPPSGGGLGKGAKISIWLGAVAIGTVWAWKTFSVTRGTD
jgi:hypothetical protein